MRVTAQTPFATWHAWRRRTVARRATSASLAALLEAPRPPLRAHWRDTEWLALDIETTSLHADRATLVSIGWVPVSHARLVLSDAMHLLVSGGDPVGQSATVHRVTDTSRGAGIPLHDALEQLWIAAANRIPLFHGAALDIAVLDRLATQLFGAPWMPWHADTLALERRRLERGNRVVRQGELSLAAVRERYGLPSLTAHHALADALATAELFLAQCASRGAPTLAELLY